MHLHPAAAEYGEYAVSARTRKDWILWAQLGCALVVTFHAEYTLALAAGVNEYVALAVPGALDLYVIRALQKHRDVFAAVLVMVAANVASHLVSAGLIPVGWAVYSAVGGTVPLLLWRGHALRQETAGPGEVSAPVLVDEYTDECECPWWRRVLAWLDWRECACTPDVPGTSTPHPEPYPDEVQVHSLKYAPEYGLSAPHSPEPAPVLVPSTPHPPVPGDEYAALEAKWLTEYEKSALSTHSPIPYLAAVPDLPDEYAASAVHSDVLEASDWDYVDGAAEYCASTKSPTYRGLMRHMKIGQKRAERLLAHLGVKP